MAYTNLTLMGIARLDLGSIHQKIDSNGEPYYVRDLNIIRGTETFKMVLFADSADALELQLAKE